MIASLHIENIAVIKQLDVDFRGGFTVLSGETGAGKSIIIDSLGLLKGDRADRELIRTGESTAEVSALFSGLSDKAIQTLEEMGFSVSDETVMLSRTVRADGPSVARLNGRSITMSMLREIAAVLFSIHGQNDNQLLMEKRNHLGVLDSFSGSEELLKEYGTVYRQVLHLRAQIDSIRRDAMESNRMREMLRYQIEDIDSAKLKSGEEEALEAESKRLGSVERIHKATALVSRALQGGEKGIGAVYLTERASAALSQISDAVPEATKLVERLTDIRYELDDIAMTVAEMELEDGEDPTAKIDRIEGRLQTIAKLKRKYGGTVEEILAFRADAAEKLDLIENAEDRMADLEAECHQKEAQAEDIALRLREMRQHAAAELTERVSTTLAFLDMPKVRFSVGMKPTADFTAFGRDDVEFLISTNPGEPLLPMIKIASGGELSRIMLSLKSVLNECDGMDCVIFDEIDTGISGKTSRKVGIKLKEIARGAQVLCVTHSAQIASLATHHLYIAKSEVEGRMQTALRVLNEQERVEEIARILGGIEISEVQRSAAREMIEEGAQYL